MEKGKKQKKVVAVLLLLAMIMAAAPVGVKADHLNPNYNNGQRCNNTYKSYTHTGYQASINQGSHSTSDGLGCVMTGLIYKHSVACTSCGFVYSSPIYPCTTAHSRCGNRTVNHSGF